jgi:hypothetical protein
MLHNFKALRCSIVCFEIAPLRCKGVHVNFDGFIDSNLNSSKTYIMPIIAFLFTGEFKKNYSIFKKQHKKFLVPFYILMSSFPNIKTKIKTKTKIKIKIKFNFFP